MNDKVEATEVTLERGEHGVELIMHDAALEAHLISEGDFGASLAEALGDGPGDGALVGNPQNETLLARQIDAIHGVLLYGVALYTV